MSIRWRVRLCRLLHTLRNKVVREGHPNAFRWSIEYCRLRHHLATHAFVCRMISIVRRYSDSTRQTAFSTSPFYTTNCVFRLSTARELLRRNSFAGRNKRIRMLTYRYTVCAMRLRFRAVLVDLTRGFFTLSLSSSNCR